MKIAIIHFRLGETDGVSLEAEKRIKILKKLGHKLHYICGECPKEFREKNKKNLSIIPELHLLKERTVFMLTTAIKAKQMNLPESVMTHWFADQEQKIYKRFDKIFSKHKFDRIIVHNIFSNPLVPPASIALVDILDKYEIPTLVVNHDFYFERWGFLETPYKYVREKISTLPPKRPFITHNVINSLAKQELYKRKDISADIIGDTWDFGMRPQKKDDYNKDFRKSFRIKPDDLLILQATRITPNKCIENAVLFCHQLEKKLRASAPLDVLGKNFTKQSRVVLFLSNRTNVGDQGSRSYLKRVLTLARKLDVRVVKGFDHIAIKRNPNNSRKVYSFWDAYVHADLVTYPSCQEGFGNQLLETFFYKKLPVLFEYPVFKSDIKPDGYKYVSLGSSLQTHRGLRLVSNHAVEKAAKETFGILTKPKRYKKIVNHNFKKAKKHHGISSLKENLSKWLKPKL